MKKLLMLSTFFILSSNAQAAIGCAKYENYPRYVKAIETVAAYLGKTTEEFCSNPRVLDIEAQPSRKVTREGEVIPHVAVQEHFAYDSCLYMVNETNYSISEVRCYNGF